MQLEIPSAVILSVMLGAARAGAFLFIAPPFANRAIPRPAKALLSVAISMPVVATQQNRVPSADTAAVVSALVLQIITGAALGFVCLLIFTAVSTAGDLLDVFGGFSLTFAQDPLMSAGGNAVWGKAFTMIATTLLFTSGGYLIMLQGFLRSFDAVPLDSGLDLTTLASVLTSGLGELLVSALQICAPLLAVLFLADVGLGLLTRVAPALNAFSLAFPAKILLTMVMVSATIAGLPAVVQLLTGTMGSTLVRLVSP